MVAPRNSSSASYTPGPVPTDTKDMPRFIREELDKIAAAMALLAAGHLDKSYAAPLRPRDGDIRYAAGAPDWNPGSGQGIYYFNGTIWTLLG